jgi:transcriptional regulator with XRE-family HTH domain
MTTVQRWSGLEAKLLRHALRLTIEALAGLLGVSSRTVAKWEARGSSITPTPDMQAVLDTALTGADSDAQLRFSRSHSAANVHPPASRQLSSWPPQREALATAEDSSLLSAIRAFARLTVRSGVAISIPASSAISRLT